MMEKFLRTSSSERINTSQWYSPETGIYHSKHPSVNLPANDSLLDVVSFIFSHKHNGRTALVDSLSGYSISYPQLFPLVQSVASGLRHHFGISQGDVVLLLLPNSIYFPVIFLALLHLGAIVIPMNPLFSVSEIKKQVTLCKTKISLAFTIYENVDKLRSWGTTPVIAVPENLVNDFKEVRFSDFHKLITGKFDLVERPVIRQQDTAAILNSSGTTGASKGAVLTHGNFIAAVELFVRFEASQYEYLSSEAVFLAVLPMFHIYGLSLFTSGLLSLGASVVVMRRFEASEMLKVIDKYGVTHFPVVPPILMALTKAAKGLCGNSLKSLKQVSSGAAPAFLTKLSQLTAMDSLLQTLQSSPIFFITLPLLLAFALFSLTTLRKKLPYPPGPKGFPIIGNMAMMDQLTHRGLADLAKKYGGLLHLQMGAIHVVAVSTPDMAKEVLQAQDLVFANRPANVAITYLTYDRADMAFANYGPFWRQMRKICVIKLFSRRREESWASVREEVGSTLQTVMNTTGSKVNIGELVFALTRNITYRAAFGSFSHDGQDEFVKILQEFSKLFGAFNIADFFPWMGWINARGFYKRMARARESLDGFIDSIIDEHMKKKKKKNVRDEEGKINNNDGEAEAEADTDMVDELMAFYSEEEGVAAKGDGDDLQSAKLTRDHIKAIIMDVMFGGTETVASAIEWAMAELMKSPHDLKKVQEELADKVGLTRIPHDSDLKQLTYLKCCIKETLRLHPPIPLLLHETASNTVVSGYSIPAKSRVMINAWAIGRDPSAWEDPDKFNPARFLHENAPDFTGNHFEYIPFGSGRRSCPGMQLGLYALELSVAHLLHCFNWELPDGMSPGELDMNDMFGLTAPKACRLVAVPSYRLTCPLKIF